ncbi:hypothetical protein PTSG_06806 [Salpingoeca rosetta]|uniref:Tyrosine specific protein phosphatases domain-containing protein n=1 Tax=Salpingoeca rosetta (strain ATCC 50818 / BSB-021) TaxID=946362 RepID=F2UEV2_SALR5|nr:uncharacterized protein PTSG_06806 [Salpingoeca rosetta]EGD75152.1 hypothetical protein PTSG_06806 [Salpingoeca rosetta]|eukprot:XP_004992205.1 hypothetical protein PTSG_06806 [Salpingoeca rosetta]
MRCCVLACWQVPSRTRSGLDWTGLDWAEAEVLKLASLQEQLQERRDKLRPTETVVRQGPAHFVVDTEPDLKVARVLDLNVFVGSQDAAADIDTLQRHGITHILNTQLSDVLPQAFAFIRTADRVLVHCNAGVSRSVSVALAYCIVEKGVALSAAFEDLKAKRPAVRPNAGFWQQLTVLEQQRLQSAQDPGQTR